MCRDGTFHPGQFFGIGMMVGILIGAIVGSILALRLADETAEAVRYLLDRLTGRRDRVNFELLLQ